MESGFDRHWNELRKTAFSLIIRNVMPYYLEIANLKQKTFAFEIKDLSVSFYTAIILWFISIFVFVIEIMV